MSEPHRRFAAMAGVLVLTLVATWWAWPRPAVELRVELGGRGVVVDWFGRTTALPETIRVSARGRNTRIRIENRDTTFQSLGMFGVAANSTRSFSVPLPGSYGGYCSAHPTGQITYLVQ
ncbi:MAG: hypothetical protein IT355_12935 [Gemmatimonadaceae bacterium]|nr:hypothetical protein [Gemmatimonadaceae bacterium]